jgi:hypothetical protein
MLRRKIIDTLEAWYQSGLQAVENVNWINPKLELIWNNSYFTNCREVRHRPPYPYRDKQSQFDEGK